MLRKNKLVLSAICGTLTLNCWMACRTSAAPPSERTEGADSLIVRARSMLKKDDTPRTPEVWYKPVATPRELNEKDLPRAKTLATPEASRSTIHSTKTTETPVKAASNSAMRIADVPANTGSSLPVHEATEAVFIESEGPAFPTAYGPMSAPQTVYRQDPKITQVSVPGERVYVAPPEHIVMPTAEEMGYPVPRGYHSMHHSSASIMQYRYFRPKPTTLMEAIKFFFLKIKTKLFAVEVIHDEPVEVIEEVVVEAPAPKRASRVTVSAKPEAAKPPTAATPRPKVHVETKTKTATDASTAAVVERERVIAAMRSALDLETPAKQPPATARPQAKTTTRVAKSTPAKQVSTEKAKEVAVSEKVVKPEVSRSKPPFSQINAPNSASQLKKAEPSVSKAAPSNASSSVAQKTTPADAKSTKKVEEKPAPAKASKQQVAATKKAGTHAEKPKASDVAKANPAAKEVVQTSATKKKDEAKTQSEVQVASLMESDADKSEKVIRIPVATKKKSVSPVSHEVKTETKAAPETVKPAPDEKPVSKTPAATEVPVVERSASIVGVSLYEGRPGPYTEVRPGDTGNAWMPEKPHAVADPVIRYIAIDEVAAATDPEPAAKSETKVEPAKTKADESDDKTTVTTATTDEKETVAANIPTLPEQPTTQSGGSTAEVTEPAASSTDSTPTVANTEAAKQEASNEMETPKAADEVAKQETSEEVVKQEASDEVVKQEPPTEVENPKDEVAPASVAQSSDASTAETATAQTTETATATTTETAAAPMTETEVAAATETATAVTETATAPAEPMTPAETMVQKPDANPVAKSLEPMLSKPVANPEDEPADQSVQPARYVPLPALEESSTIAPLSVPSTTRASKAPEVLPPSGYAHVSKAEPAANINSVPAPTVSRQSSVPTPQPTYTTAFDHAVAEECSKTLLTGKIEVDRQKAIATLASMHNWYQHPMAVSAVIRVSLTDYNTQMRHTAVEMLSSIASRKGAVVETLKLSAKYDTDEQIRRIAATACNGNNG